MSARSGRHARGKSDWGTQGGRSAEIREAAAAADPDPARAAPGKKDRKARCKAAQGGPHVPGLAFTPPVFARRESPQACHWAPAGWVSGPPRAGWRCYHQEECSRCGKVSRTQISHEECPYYPGDPRQREAAEAEARELEQEHTEWRARWSRRKPPVTGPQGYRRKRPG